MNEWKAIEYSFTGPNGDVFAVQWDGLRDQWYICGTYPPEWYFSLASAMLRAEQLGNVGPIS